MIFYYAVIFCVFALSASQLGRDKIPALSVVRLFQPVITLCPALRVPYFCAQRDVASVSGLRFEHHVIAYASVVLSPHLGAYAGVILLRRIPQRAQVLLCFEAFNGAG